MKYIASLIEKNQIEEAVSEFEKIPMQELGELELVIYACLSFDVCNFSRVIDIFENRVSRKVLGAEALRVLARSYEELGKTEFANKYYKQAIETGEEYTELYFDYAYAMDEQGNRDEAIKYYKKVIELDPNKYWAYINLGSIYEKENKDLEAIELYKTAYAIDPKGSMVNYNLGVSYVKMGNFDEGLKHYLEETKVDNPFPTAFFNLALLYKNQYHDFNNARFYNLKTIEVVGKLIKDDKRHERLYYYAWYNLGCLYAVYNDFQNASDCFKYIYYKKKKYLDYIYDDPELASFRESNEFKEIDNLLGGKDEEDR